MRTTIAIVLASVTALAAQGCSTWTMNGDGHVVGQGEVVKRTLQVPDFHSIEVEGSMNVELTPSSERSVVVEAQANIAELVTTEVTNGVWHIATKEGYSTSKDFVVRIALPTLRSVSVSGSGDVKGMGRFKVEDLALTTEGSGNITLEVEAKHVTTSTAGSGDTKLSGSAAQLKVAVDGSGDVNARDLACTQVAVDVAGSGDVVVSVAEELEATISGSGNVSYVGSPAHVRKDVSGSGEIRQWQGKAQAGRI